MDPLNQSKELFKGAFILTVAALLTKILSAIYRIPFQNIVGDVGFYIYQQVYPFYGIAVVLATTGFPVVISKLYAELKEKKDVEGARRLLFISFFFLQAFGFLCFLLLYTGAENIAFWMHDPDLAILLKVVSVVFLTFPIISVLRGYFQGIGNMIPTAVSQVGEQSIRVVTILFLAFLFTQQGYSLYYVGGGAMFGSITGGIVSAIVLFLFLWMGKKRKLLKISEVRFRSIFAEYRKVVNALAFQGLAICITGMLLIFIQLADALNLFSLLVSNGMEEEGAKALKGVYDRGQPLIQLGTVVATSISLTLVPLITAERMKERSQFLYHKIRLAMQINIVIGVAATVGLWAIIEPTNIMLFENSAGSDVLGILTLIILLNSLISTMTAILQGLGFLIFPAFAILLSFPLKFVLNIVLIPLYGSTGAAIATIVTLSVIAIFIGVKLKNKVTQVIIEISFLKTVLLAATTMAITLRIYIFASGFILANSGTLRLGATIQSLSAVLIGGFIYLFIIIRKSTFRIDELAMFPFGSKLLLLLPKQDRGQKE